LAPPKQPCDKNVDKKDLDLQPPYKAMNPEKCSVPGLKGALEASLALFIDMQARNASQVALWRTAEAALTPPIMTAAAN
jgi:hypothetical protein